MNQTARIKVEGISKKYVTNLRRSMLYGIQDIAHDFFGLSARRDRLRKDEFWAVKDVSFELSPGDTLGIVGANGSGKSTLLKLLNGLIKPDTGRISIRGRTGALIEVGAGFHPLLTGRENIFVNGAILGMGRAEIKRKWDSIVEFAGIGDFLDMPVKFYSSGMYVRLGFAVAAHCEPDILLVDEVLAVGDVAFQKKCFRFIEETILGKGVILCFVSHSIYTVTRLCSKALLLDRGCIRFAGKASEVTPEYYKASRAQSMGNSSRPEPRRPDQDYAKEVRLTHVEMCDGSGNPVDSLQTGDPVEFRLYLDAVREMHFMPRPSLKITDLSGTAIVYSTTRGSDQEWMRLRKGENIVRCRFDSLNLIMGQYVLQAKLGGAGDLVQDFVREAKLFEVKGANEQYESSLGAGLVYAKNQWSLL